MSESIKFELELLPNNGLANKGFNHSTSAIKTIMLGEISQNGGACKCGNVTNIKITAVFDSNPKVEVKNWCCSEFQQRAANLLSFQVGR